MLRLIIIVYSSTIFTSLKSVRTVDGNSRCATEEETGFFVKEVAKNLNIWCSRANEILLTQHPTSRPMFRSYLARGEKFVSTAHNNLCVVLRVDAYK